jgi:hypothetical protein
MISFVNVLNGTVVGTVILMVFMFLLTGCGNDTDRQVLEAYSCSVKQVDGGALITCPDGTQQVILNGQDGSNGVDGQDGLNGSDGQNGVDGQDGQDGADGVDGQDAELPGTAIIDTIDPCGPSGGFDEILLVLADGRIIAYFAGNEGFLTALNCNQNYRTTDAQRCRFTINQACEYVENN